MKEYPINVLANEKEVALFFIKVLKSKGFEAFLVGGCVRDYLLSLLEEYKDIKVNDFDITTSAHPDEIIESLREHVKSFDLGGKKFCVIFADGLEIATFREEEYIVQGKPETKPAKSFKDDAARRDFTINALAMDEEGNIVDYFNGVKDLHDKIVRFVGDPYKRIEEDASRMLRACEIAARLSFTIEKESFKAIQNTASSIQEVPFELVGKIIGKAIKHKKFHVFLQNLKATGLLKYIFSELFSLNDTEFEEVCAVLEKIQQQEKKNQALIFASALYKSSPKKAYEKIILFSLGKDLAEEVKFFVKHHKDFFFENESEIKDKITELSLEAKHKEDLINKIESLFIFKTVHSNVLNLNTVHSIYSKILLNTIFYVKELPITGDDLMSVLGLTPGKHIGIILNKLVKENIQSKDEALEFAKKEYVQLQTKS